MNRPPVVGECVVVQEASDCQSVLPGERLVVSKVDESDDTLRGRRDGIGTPIAEWISWDDVEPVAFGWDYAARHLPSDVTALLSACDGTHCLSLNLRIKEAIVESLPDWRSRVLQVIAAGTLGDRTDP
jgi:hypothetical protein